MKHFLSTSMLLLCSLLGAKGEVDPNFYVYLCFGQSNMEGNATTWELMYFQCDLIDNIQLTLF